MFTEYYAFPEFTSREQHPRKSNSPTSTCSLIIQNKILNALLFSFMRAVYSAHLNRPHFIILIECGEKYKDKAPKFEISAFRCYRHSFKSKHINLLRTSF